MWSTWIADSLTGIRQMRIYPAAGGHRTVANGFGEGSHTLRLWDEREQAGESWPGVRDVLREITRPWAYTIVACWNDDPQYAGFIRRREYKKATGELTLKSAEWRCILKDRYQYDIFEHVQDGALSFPNRTLRGAAKKVLQRGLFRDTGGPWDLAVVFEFEDEAGTFDFKSEAHRFESIEQMLTRIQDADGGPDIHFRPQWVNGKLRVTVRIGAPQLTGPLIDLSASAAESPVVDLEEVDDGLEQKTGLWGQGEGSEVGMRLGRAGNLTGHPVVPYMDSTRPFKAVKDEGQLDKLAMGELKAVRDPITSHTFGLKLGTADVMPLVGSTVKVDVRDDVWMPDGVRTGYVIGVSGTVGSNDIGLEMR